MKGLLLKDAYQMWYYTRMLILAAVVMMLVGVFGMKEGSNFFMLYGGFLLGIFPMTLLAYDQNSRFSAYSAALPVTKEQLVGSKDLIGLGAMALSELLSMAALAAALSAPLPGMLRADRDIWQDASAYFLVYSLFLPALQLDNVAAGQLQATGNMRTPGICMVVMCALDVVFNTLFIFPSGTVRLGSLALPGAGLGTAGAALGTGLAELVVGLYLLYFVLRRSPVLRLQKGEHLRFNRPQLCTMLCIAAPVASEKVILTTAQIVSTAIVAPLGTVAIAANSFAITAESLCYMPAYGIQSAAAMLVGQSVGAGRRNMARRLGWVTVLIGVAVMVITGGLLYILAPQMMAILTPNPDIIALGARILRIEAFAEPLFGASIVAGGVFQGVGSTLMPTLFNLGTMWGIRIPLAWLAAPRWGLPGVWAAMCLELCVRGVLYLTRLAGKRWLPPGDQNEQA